jgi:hypothetical protein
MLSETLIVSRKVGGAVQVLARLSAFGEIGEFGRGGWFFSSLSNAAPDGAVSAITIGERPLFGVSAMELDAHGET